VDISCGLPGGPGALELARRAEELGYERVWLYDSPALYQDVWVWLGLIATGTDRIKLGTAVLVPHLRHVMATASAIATIESLAPGRLACGFGTGATARWTLGQPALPLAEVARYLRELRALLRGEVVEVDGRLVQMIHQPRFLPAVPIGVPLLLSALGPRGQVVARDVADGIMTTGFALPGWDWSAQLVYGTVLDRGEGLTAGRVKEAVGPWYTTLMYHGTWQFAPEALDGLPDGASWRAGIEAERPDGQRHLAVHRGHATDVVDHDRAVVDAAGELLGTIGWVADRDGIAGRLRTAEADGSTEVIYAPAGPDPLRELQAFAEAASAHMTR